MNIAMIGQKGVGASARSGGVEKHVRELGSRLVKNGHDVVVYARKKYHPRAPREFLGMRLVYVPTVYYQSTEAIIAVFFSTLHAMYSGFDIIHYHGVGPAMLAWIPKLFARKARVIVTFHSRDQFHKKWGWFGRLFLRFGERAAVAFSHYCIAVSHEIQVYCRDVFGKEVVFIPNGAEVRFVKGTDKIEALGLEVGEYVLSVGRLVPQKGLQFLIEAFRAIDTHKQLVIVGDAGFSREYELHLRALAEGDHRIRFLGFRGGEELDQLFAHAYLFCHPSEAEGLPLVILEAMSYGLLPLVSDIAPNVEAIHGAGFLFASGDAEDLRKKLEDLFEHPVAVAREAERVRGIVREFFDWDMIAEHTQSVYVTSRH